MEKIFLLGVGFTSAKKEKVLEYIINFVKKGNEKGYVVTPNPELLVIAKKNVAYKNILNQANLALIDGIGVVVAGKILGKPLEERFSGVDLVVELCKRVAKQPITVGFLGGREKVAEQSADCLMEKYKGLDVVFANDEWDKKGFDFKEKYTVSSIKYQGDNKKILHTEYRIQHTAIDILFVAFGSPKQEEWIAKRLEGLPVNMAIGVGGAFDFISGKVTRAPQWMQAFGLEWLFRLIRQPWRLKRQLRLLKFCFLVIQERLKQ